MRNGKNDDLVQRVELLEANPTYARIRFPDGRESNVSLRDLARYPRGGKGEVSPEVKNCDVDNRETTEDTNNGKRDLEGFVLDRNGGDNQKRLTSNDNGVDDISLQAGSREPVDGNKAGQPQGHLASNEPESNDFEGSVETGRRRSVRGNIGVPPDRFGNPIYFD